MENKRTKEVLENLIAWILEVFDDNPETVSDMVYAMDLTDEEIDELDLREYLDDYDEDDDDEDDEDDYDEDDDEDDRSELPWDYSKHFE